MNYLLGYALFAISLYISFFIPGNLFLSILCNKKEEGSDFTNFVLSWTYGIALFLLGIYFTAYLKLNFAYLIIIALCTVIYFVRKIWLKKLFPKRIEITDKWSFALILIGSISFTSLMFFSGFPVKNGLQFIDVNAVDGIRHVGLITDQIIHFPPQEPYLAGQTLRGFHYFYDLMLSRFSLFYGFQVSDLYFRYFPLFISLIYGIGVAFITGKLTKNVGARRFVLLFAYFSQSSIVLIWPFIKSISIVDDAIVQPMGLILNPFTVLSLGLLFVALGILPLIKKSWKYALIAGIVIGVMSEIKVYSGIIALSCMSLYCLYLLIRFKKKYISSLTLLFITAVILTTVTFLPNNAGSGGFIFAPLLFYNHYLQTDIFSSLQWGSRLIVYQARNNILGIVFLYTISIFIFVLLNFGLRLILLFKIKNLLSKNFWKSDMNFILFWSILIPILIASFFIQSVSVFDTVQFFWIAISIISVPSGIVLFSIYKRTSRKLIMMILIFLVTIPGIFAVEYKYIFSSSRVIVNSQDLEVLKKVTAIVPSNAFITLLPPSPSILDDTSYVFPTGTPFVSALTKRQVYFEEGGLPATDDKILQERQAQIQKLRHALDGCDNALIRTIIIQIDSPYVVAIGNYPCLAGTFEIEKQAGSQKGGIYFYKFALK